MIYDRKLLLVLSLDPDEYRNLSEQERKKSLKKAYHKKAQEFHPDRWDEANSEISFEDTTERFKEVVHAYKMLTDASYRQKQANSGQQTSLHAVMSIDLTFHQGFFGTETTITFNPRHLDEEGNPIEVDVEKDVHFDVSVIKVRVPKNTKSGDRIVFKGKGLKQGDRQGDLIFMINVRPHSKFDYDFDTKTFHFQEKVPLEIMIGGGELEMETMFGLSQVRVPAGTTPGTRLKKKGIGDDKSYKIEVTVDPEFPNKKKLKGNKFWDKLDIDWDKEDELDEEVKQAEEDYEKIFKKLGGYKIFATGPSSQNPF